jgi:hypothetical protein
LSCSRRDTITARSASARLAALSARRTQQEGAGRFGSGRTGSATHPDGDAPGAPSAKYAQGLHKSAQSGT